MSQLSFSGGGGDGAGVTAREETNVLATQSPE